MSLQGAGQVWRRLDVTLRDLPLGTLLLVASFLPGLRGHGTQIGDLPTRPFDALAVVALTLECLSLAVRRRWPVICLALVACGFALDQLCGYHSAAGTALPIALISAGSHQEQRRRTTVVLLSVAYVPLAIALARLGSGGETATDFVTFYLMLALAWGAGAWLRSTRAAETARREHVAAETRTAERIRIARELHDVVTHNVSMMTIQAGAARKILDTAPDRAREAMAAVESGGRAAMTELRHVMGLLTMDSDTGDDPAASADLSPQPGLGRLDALVDGVRRSGLPVELTVRGERRAVPPGVELAAYRVVQEALTNTVKHAGGADAEVTVDYAPDGLRVEVTDTGGRPTGAAATGNGRGLLGLRERLAVYGGTLHTGPRPRGGYRVTASIPLESR